MTEREAIRYLIKLYDNIEKFFLRGGYHLKGEYKNALTLAISALEKLEQDRWIPVTERLPEVGQRVLVTYKNGAICALRCTDAGHLQRFYTKTVAWKPAPEPYTEEES